MSGQMSNAQNPRTVAKVSEIVAKNHQIALILMVEKLRLGGDSSNSSWQFGKEEDIHQFLSTTLLGERSSSHKLKTSSQQGGHQPSTLFTSHHASQHSSTP